MGAEREAYGRIRSVLVGHGFQEEDISRFIFEFPKDSDQTVPLSWHLTAQEICDLNIAGADAFGLERDDIKGCAMKIQENEETMKRFEGNISEWSRLEELLKSSIE